MMLRKSDIVQILSSYHFPESHYWIMAGSALVMHGVRETTADIDIGCDTLFFETLMDSGHEVLLREDGSRSLIIDDTIEVFENWMAEAIESIDGLPTASLQTVLSFKRAKARDKDLRDVALIEAFLNRKG